MARGGGFINRGVASLGHFLGIVDEVAIAIRVQRVGTQPELFLIGQAIRIGIIISGGGGASESAPLPVVGQSVEVGVVVRSRGVEGGLHGKTALINPVEFIRPQGEMPDHKVVEDAGEGLQAVGIRPEAQGGR